MELSIGEQIEFVTVPFHFYNGHQLPIVALKTDESILLSFEEGKIYHGISGNFGFALSSGFELHAGGGLTVTVAQTNVWEMANNLYIRMMGW